MIRHLFSLLVLLLCGRDLAATWSIIIVDTRTGEVAIASATCVPNYDLRSLTAVLVIGKGGACAQSYVDFSGANRLAIFNGFKSGASPQSILAGLAQSDPGHQTRQYGMVDTQGRALGFSGNQANAWKGHLTGKIVTLVYAIQGNILTGGKVITDAEAALRSTNGDLAARLMAAMEAARKMGGDGRCSCPGNPTGCGTPPASFTRSADIGFMIIGRIGDQDGVCNGASGCATGQYYMNLNVITAGSGPDPVLTLKTRYDAWRQQLRGRPDHHLSSLEVPSGSLPADGVTSTVARLVLRDLEGTRLSTGGAKVNVSLDASSTGSLVIGSIKDNGDGSYGVPLQAGSRSGTALLRIEVDDGKGKVRIGPDPEIEVTNHKLWASRTDLPVYGGGTLDFVINQGVANANRPYMLMISNSGTSPGIHVLPGQHLPLNPDNVFWTVFFLSNSAYFPGFMGSLDAQGRRTVRMTLPPGVFGLAPSSDLSFASALFYPFDNVSNPVDVRLSR